MALLRALQSGSDALRRNPSIVGIMLVVALVQLPTQFVQLAGPLASAVFGVGVSLLSVLLVPFVFAGLLGMADEALDGRTSLDTFVAAGRRYYVSMLGAYLLVLGGSVVLGVAAVVALAALGVAAFAAVGGAPGAGVSGAALAGIALVVVAWLFVLFVPLFFVQFYGQAIVLDGASAVGGFRRSARLVRRNLRAAFGYSVVVFGVGLVFGLLASVPSTLLSVQMAGPSVPSALPEVSFPVVATAIVAGTLLMGLVGSLFLTFSVAFYRSLDPDVDAENADAARGSAV